MRAWKRSCLFLICFVIYLFLGALIFEFLEEELQLVLSREAKEYHDEFLLTHPCVTSEEFVKIAKESYNTWEDNINWEEINKSDHPLTYKWTLANSLFFSATIITTIGYGHQTPTSWLSRVVFIPYALIGIPLTGLLLGSIGSMFEGVWKSMVHRLIDTMAFIKSPIYRKIVCISIMVTIVYVVIILLPTLVFVYIEEWPWSDAHYFTFTSLSTVGFGDFVAGYKPYEDSLSLTIYKLSTIAYIVLGLSVLAILLRIVQEYQDKKVVKRVKAITTSVTSKVKNTKRHSIEDTGEAMADAKDGVYLTKFAFETDQVCLSEDVYHTDEDGVTLTVDRGIQTAHTMLDETSSRHYLDNDVKVIYNMCRRRHFALKMPD